MCEPAILLSFIVPVYNTEKYLIDCIGSILSQNLEQYEIILVEDGSTDGSPRICERYRAQFPGVVRVLCQSNLGVSAARNAGIRAARGSYVAFLDSDDFYAENAFAKLNPYLGDCDIIEFRYQDYNELDSRGKEKQAFLLQETPVPGKEYLEQCLQLEELYTWYMWKYVFRKSLFEQIMFPAGCTYEDVSVIYRVILSAQRVISVDELAYYYRTRRKGSITSVPVLSTEIDKLSVIQENIGFVLANLPEGRLRTLLCHNFSCLYYSVLTEQYYLKESAEQAMLKTELAKARWVTDYTVSGGQRVARVCLKLFGISFTAFMLVLRHTFKKLSCFKKCTKKIGAYKYER